MPSFSCYTVLLFKSCGWREQNFNPHLAQNCQSMAILKRDELRSALLLFWTYLQTTHFLMPSTLGGLCKHSPLCYALKSSATISLSTKSWFNTYCYWYFLSRRHQFLRFPPLSVDTVGPLRNVPPELLENHFAIVSLSSLPAPSLVFIYFIQSLKVGTPCASFLCTFSSYFTQGRGRGGVTNSGAKVERTEVQWQWYSNILRHSHKVSKCLLP